MFQVDWSDDSLLIDLCDIYLKHAAHRNEITYAADRVENLLCSSARTVGSQVSPEGLRKLRYEPLEIIYAIDGANVEVQTVKWAGFSTP